MNKNRAKKAPKPNGVIALDADALRDGHIQAAVFMKVKIVDLDIKQVLPGVDPVVADGRRYLPARPCRAEFLRAGDRQKVVLLEQRPIVIGQDVAVHSPPCNERTILCNDQAGSAAGGC